MSDLQEAQRLHEAAERAATAGDFATAADYLAGAARLQEAALGPLHPELANTLNNLAIITEQSGRPADAEPFYRRAAGIAAAALPADHPMVADSRRNLEEFCRARGVPIDLPIVISPSARDIELGLDAFAPDAAGAAKKPAEARAVGRSTPVSRPSPAASPAAPPAGAIPAGATAPAAITPAATPPRAGSPAALPPVVTPTAAGSPRPAAAASAEATYEAVPLASSTGSRSLTWVVAALVILGAAALLVLRPWSADTPPATAAAPVTEAPATAPASPAPEPVPSQPAAQSAQPPAPVPSAAPSAAPKEPPTEPQSAATAPVPSSASASGAISVATAQVCQTFSTSGGRWRCDPAGAVAAPGPLVFFTRIKSPRNVDVVHRWYRGETLRRTVTLSVRANPTDGYRTYSRQTVDAADNWRVELRGTDGSLLFEQRFAVK